MLSLEQFEKELSAVKEKRTCESYVLGAGKFLKFLDANNLVLASADRNTLQTFVEYLATAHKPKLEPSSVRVYLAGTRKYLEWSKRNGEQVADFSRPELPKSHSRVKRALDEQQLYEYVRLSRLLNEPYRTVLIMLPLTGMRVQEMCRLCLAHVRKTPYGWMLEVRTTKTHVDRDVPVLPLGSSVLVEYLKYVRPELGDADWLFPVHRQHVSTRTIQAHLRRIRAQIGLSWLTPHALRHTYATRLARAGVDPVLRAKILGHSVATSMIYTHHTDEDLFAGVTKVKADWLKPEGE